MTRGALLLAVASTAVAIGAQPANAGFRVCNQFERRVDVAFGYVDRQQGWMAQGWYIIEPSACKDVHRADLDNRYYYLFIRSSRDAMWTGDVPFCIQKKKFLLVQSQYGKNSPDECHGASLDYAQFFKVDVNGTKDFTYNLSGTPGPVAPPQQPPVAAPPGPPPNQQPPQPPRPPVATAPAQPPYQQAPQTPPPQPYQPTPQPNRPPVATAPAQQPYQQAPQAPPPQPYQPAQQPNRPPVATAPSQPVPQVPPPQQPYQPYQPAPRAPMQQPQQAPQPDDPAPQPQAYQQPQQQPAPPPAQGGTACQRYPNLC